MTGAALLVALFAGSPAVAEPVRPDAPVRILPGSPVQREIAAGETHRFTLATAGGTFVRVRVRPSADLAVRLSVGEAMLAESVGRGDAPRIVSAVVEQAGDASIEVRGTAAPGRAIRYEIAVVAVRPRAPEDDEHLAADRLFAEAQALHRSGAPPALREAVAAYRRVLDAWRTSGGAHDQADGLAALGEATFALGDVPGARALFDEELSLRRAAGDQRGEATAHNNVAVTLSMQGLRTEAIEHYGKALALHRASGDRPGEGQALRNLGVTYVMVNEYQKGLEALRASLPIRREEGDLAGEGATLHSLGGLHFRLGEFDAALAYAQQALAVRRKAGDRLGEAHTLQTLGLVYDRRGEKPKARAFYEQALSLVREVGDRTTEAAVLHALGDSYAPTERARALEHYQRALAIVRATGERPIEGVLLRAVGVNLQAAGEVAAARRHLEESLVVEREVGDQLGEAATLHALARLEREHGDLGRAREHMEASLARVDALRVRVARQDLREVFVASRQRHYEDYVELLMEQNRREPDAYPVAAAFAAVEHARARTLRDILLEAGAEVRRGTDPQLATRLRQAQERLNAREQARARVLARRTGEDARAAARRAVAEALAEYQEVEAELRRANPRLAALQQPQPQSAAELQALLDEDTLVLEYALGEKKSHLFVVSSATLDAVELPPRAVLEAAALRFRERLRASRYRAGRAAAVAASREAADLLVGPARRWLHARRLVIVPDGGLHLVPFGALVAAGSGRPLVVDHEIVQLPSLGVLAQLRAQDEGARRTEAAVSPAAPAVFVVADPVLDAGDPRVRPAGRAVPSPNGAPADLARPPDRRRSGAEPGPARFDRLPFTRQEADGIRRAFGADAVTVALDFEASRETVLGGALRRARIVHFATHALMNGEHPELSGLVLSQVDAEGKPREGFVRLHDVYNLELDADLVVLSACRTAAGREVRGEGVVSLTRGFMYAGAPRVLASLGDVRDEASAELMTRFYDGLVRRKLRPAAALRDAQVSLWKDPRWSAPFYWAGFVLQGEWR